MHQDQPNPNVHRTEKAPSSKAPLSKALWTETWRPQQTADFIGLDHLLAEIKKQCPFGNMAFIGPSGTGKTSLARLISKGLEYGQGEDNTMDDSSVAALLLNMSETRGVSVVADRIWPFTKQAGKARIVIILDEADGMTREAQRSLSALMDWQPHHVQFILISNAELGNKNSAVLPSLLSRFKLFFFPALTSLLLRTGLERLCSKHHQTILATDLQLVIDHCQGDVRRAVSHLQRLVLTRPQTSLRDEKWAPEGVVLTDEKDGPVQKDRPVTDTAAWGQTTLDQICKKNLFTCFQNVLTFFRQGGSFDGVCSQLLDAALCSTEAICSTKSLTCNPTRVSSSVMIPSAFYRVLAQSKTMALYSSSEGQLQALSLVALLCNVF